jgi:hypothetical protein
MNERIKELAIEAGYQPLPGFDFANSLEETYLKKFAQLIIRECAEVCYDHSNAAGGVDTHFGYGYKDCGNDIKRNFGVEL